MRCCAARSSRKQCRTGHRDDTATDARTGPVLLATDRDPGTQAEDDNLLHRIRHRRRRSAPGRAPWPPAGGFVLFRVTRHRCLRLLVRWISPFSGWMSLKAARGIWCLRRRLPASDGGAARDCVSRVSCPSVRCSVCPATPPRPAVLRSRAVSLRAGLTGLGPQNRICARSMSVWFPLPLCAPSSSRAASSATVALCEPFQRASLATVRPNRASPAALGPRRAHCLARAQPCSATTGSSFAACQAGYSPKNTPELAATTAPSAVPCAETVKVQPLAWQIP